MRSSGLLGAADHSRAQSKALWRKISLASDDPERGSAHFLMSFAKLSSAVAGTK
jgi:hypothetical protein